MYFETRGPRDAFPVVFGHGWGRDHRDFIPIVELLGDSANVILLDFPGFGQSPHPGVAWNTEEYARSTRAFLSRELGINRYIWVGHSFGGRVGLRLGAMPDSPIEHLFIIAGAGIKMPTNYVQRARKRWQSWNFKRRKAAVRSEDELIELESRFGSRDYVASRQTGMREIFVKTVEEDQSKTVSSIICPTTLVYGSQDIETPPELGRLLNGLVPNSTYLECPEFDHHTILTRGRHQLTIMLLEAIRGVSK